MTVGASELTDELEGENGKTLLEFFGGLPFGEGEGDEAAREPKEVLRGPNLITNGEVTTRGGECEPAEEDLRSLDIQEPLFTLCWCSKTVGALDCFTGLMLIEAL